VEQNQESYIRRITTHLMQIQQGRRIAK